MADVKQLMRQLHLGISVDGKFRNGVGSSTNKRKEGDNPKTEREVDGFF